MQFVEVPTCILCKLCFSSSRLPCIQRCNHPLCLECVITISNHQKEFTCPVDKKVLQTSTRVNQALSLISDSSYLNTTIDAPIEPIAPVEPVDIIENYLYKFAQFLRLNFNLISVQLVRKLLHILQSTVYHHETRREFLVRFKSVFQRLLLEVVQTCCDSKQRMYAFRRLVNNKGCTIDDPELTDRVIGALIKLYNAVGHYSDSSFTRDALTEYVSHEVEVVTGGNRPRKKLVERVIQTLYRASCFELIKMVNEPGKLKLREHLRSALELRRQHDEELIKMALEARIRLAPENWAYLLCMRTEPHAQASMQSLLDKYNSPVTVRELESSLIDSQNNTCRSSGSIYHFEMYLDDLKFIEQNLDRNSVMKQEMDLSKLAEAFQRLYDVRQLFLVRRSKVLQHHESVL